MHVSSVKKVMINYWLDVQSETRFSYLTGISYTNQVIRFITLTKAYIRWIGVIKAPLWLLVVEIVNFN